MSSHLTVGQEVTADVSIATALSSDWLKLAVGLLRRRCFKLWADADESMCVTYKLIDSWTRVSQRTYNHDINTQQKLSGLRSHSVKSNPQMVCSLSEPQKHNYYEELKMGLADEESAVWLLWWFSTLLSGYYGDSSILCQWRPQIDGSDSPWVPQIIKIFSALVGGHSAEGTDRNFMKSNFCFCFGGVI